MDPYCVFSPGNLDARLISFGCHDARSIDNSASSRSCASRTSASSPSLLAPCPFPSTSDAEGLDSASFCCVQLEVWFPLALPLAALVVSRSLSSATFSTFSFLALAWALLSVSFPATDKLSLVSVVDTELCVFTLLLLLLQLESWDSVVELLPAVEDDVTSGLCVDWLPFVEEEATLSSCVFATASPPPPPPGGAWYGLSSPDGGTGVTISSRVISLDVPLTSLVHIWFQPSPRRRQSSLTMISQLPSNSTSKVMCLRGSRLMRTCGTCAGSESKRRKIKAWKAASSITPITPTGSDDDRSWTLSLKIHWNNWECIYLVIVVISTKLEFHILPCGISPQRNKWHKPYAVREHSTTISVNDYS